MEYVSEVVWAHGPKAAIQVPVGCLQTTGIVGPVTLHWLALRVLFALPGLYALVQKSGDKLR